MKEIIIGTGLIIGSLIGYAITKNVDVTAGQIMATVIFALISHFYSRLER